MKRFQSLTVLLVIWLCSVCVGQHHTATTIKGSEHPEQISDQRAWLMHLLASTSSDHFQNGLDKATLTDFRASFDRLTTEYNARLSDGKHGTTAADIALRQQFFEDVEQLLKITIGKLQNSMSPADWKATTKAIQSHKASMTVTDDTQTASAVTSAVYHPGEAKLIRAQWVYLIGYAAAGYTTYSIVYTDGSYYHQQVQIYGASTGQWTCEWNQYQGMWEPPGCPAHHDFYTSNQIGGRGWSNYYEGTAWNPAQYMQIQHQLDEPVGPNDGSQTIYTDATIICSVAGILLSGVEDKLIWSNIRFGNTQEAWDNSVGKSPGGNTTCGTYPVCSNKGPYLVDIPYTFANVNGCYRGYSCNSLCLRPPGGNWTCFGHDPTTTACIGLNVGVPRNPPDQCDEYP